ncbi:SemiSWEET family sugar transporter [Patescibacteria group bacterium]
MNIITQIIGFLATLVGTSLMLPQVIQSIKTKKVDDISFVMLFLYFLNCLLWLIYGILIIALPLIICNFIALIISIIQLILKFKYNKKSSVF